MAKIYNNKDPISDLLEEAKAPGIDLDFGTRYHVEGFAKSIHYKIIV